MPRHAKPGGTAKQAASSQERDEAFFVSAGRHPDTLKNKSRKRKKEMAKKSQQEFVQHITPRSEDFSQWYTDVVRLADLMDYTPVRGCMAIKPYGYGIWELIQQQMDAEFKRTGHKNVSMPMLIPESLLLKEAEHVEGFAPEAAWVTQAALSR